MNNALFVVPLAVIVAVTAPVPGVESQQQEAEAAIRQAAEGFAEAFDRSDAVALANHFTVDAVYTDENGRRFVGREAIGQEYETLFAGRSDLRLRLEIDSIQFVGATTAIEQGRIALTPQPPGASRVISVYTAVHTLHNGKWLMANVRDTRVELPPDYGQLADLQWLVGTWIAESQDTRVEVKARWVENNHFLARTHSVTESGQVASTGIEMIGVDALSGQITSWSFTSDGGRAVGLWAPHDKGWVVESVGVTSDAVQTIATDTLTQVDENTVTWKSTDRLAGELTLPDTEAVTLKRQ